MDIIKKINQIAIDYFDDNNSKFAAKMDTSEANIRNYRTKIIPKVDFLVRLCNELEISFDWLFNDEGEKEKYKRPRRLNQPSTGLITSLGAPSVVTVNENDKELITIVPAKAAAGYLNGYSDPEFIESLPTIRLPGYSKLTHRGFEIRGHSMGVIHHGAIAIGRWEESLNNIRDRRIYIVVTKTDGIVMKRVLNRISEAGKLVLISDNQNKRDYPNYSIDPEDVIELWNLKTAVIHNFPEPGELFNRFNDMEAKITLLEDKFKQLGLK